jgi:hypothetical protein
MPLAAELVEKLDELRDGRRGLSQVQMLVAAQREGLRVTTGQMKEYFRSYLDERGREVTHQEMPSRGKFYAEGPEERWMVDLAVYDAKKKVDGMVGFLLVMDTFTKQIWAEPIPDKFSSATADAFKKVLFRASHSDAHAREILKDLILTSDQGNEFRGMFRAWLLRNGVIWRVRSPDAHNELGALDQAMGWVKRLLKEEVENRGRRGQWRPGDLQMIVDKWNESYNKAAHGYPQDADNPDGNADQEFLILQDMARAFAHNHDNEASMHDAVMRHRRFIAPVIPEKAFRERVFSLKFGGPKVARSGRPGVIVDTQGNEHTLKAVQPLGMDRRGETEEPVPEEEPVPPRPRVRRFKGLRDMAAKPRYGPRRGVAERGVVREGAEPASSGRRRAEPGPMPEPPEPPPPEAPRERRPARREVDEMELILGPDFRDAPEPRELRPDPFLSGTLPADPAERLAILRRMRNILIKVRFKPLTVDESVFLDTWKAATPNTRAELDKAFKKIETERVK